MTDRPNLLFIMADQFRAMAIGSLGTDPVDTPNLDRLAEQGAHLPHAVSNYPVCSPHRAMFLTGQHPSSNGVPLNVNSRTAPRGVGIRPDAPSWARVLRDEGYRTGYIGKWHLQPPTEDDARYGEGLRDGTVWDAYSPLDRRYGFDFWYAYGAADTHLSPHYWVGDAPRERRTDVARWSAEHETDVAIDFIAERETDDRPFALVVSFNPPHQPFGAIPERYRHRYDDLSDDDLLTRPNVHLGTPVAEEAAAIARDYFCAVTAVDDQIGRLLGALDEHGLESETIVVFSSDHGMQLGSHDLIYKNVPFEESMRLPFVLRWPGHVPVGACPELLDSADIAPTLLGLVGRADALPPGMQGHDRSGALTGASEPSADPAALYYFFPSEDDGLDVRGLRTRTAKLVATAGPSGNLTIDYYDLRADPFELHSDPSHPDVPTLGRRLLDELDRVGERWRGSAALRAVIEARG